MMKHIFKNKENVQQISCKKLTTWVLSLSNQNQPNMSWATS
jgi:hypothetical protein